MHRQPGEHVERVGDAAVGRVLDRHDAEVGVPAIDLLEHRGDAADRHQLDALAEAMDGRQMAVAVGRPEIGDAQLFFQRPRAADQLAKDGADAALGERALVQRQARG